MERLDNNKIYLIDIKTKKIIELDFKDNQEIKFKDKLEEARDLLEKLNHWHGYKRYYLLVNDNIKFNYETT